MRKRHGPSDPGTSRISAQFIETLTFVFAYKPTRSRISARKRQDDIFGLRVTHFITFHHRYQGLKLQISLIAFRVVNKFPFFSNTQYSNPYCFANPYCAKCNLLPKRIIIMCITVRSSNNHISCINIPSPQMKNVSEIISITYFGNRWISHLYPTVRDT